MRDRITRVVSPQREKFDALFCELLPRLYRRAVIVSGDRHLAEDALHDVYLKLVNRPDRLLDHPDPFAYALVAVVNALRDSWRRRRRYVLTDREYDSAWDGGMAVRDSHLEATRLLAALTPKQAAVVMLVDVDGYSIDQAAAVLKLHRGTVSRTRQRAHEKLRALVGDNAGLLLRVDGGR